MNDRPPCMHYHVLNSSSDRGIPINLSPRIIAQAIINSHAEILQLRVIDRLIWLQQTGSGHESAAAAGGGLLLWVPGYWEYGRQE